MQSGFKSIVLSLIACSLLQLFACSGTGGQSSFNAGVAAVDTYLRGIEDKGFRGAVLVAKDGNKVLEKGYGIADRERNVVVTPETVFDIGSITKQFTGAAISRLEREGSVKPTDHISTYFRNVPPDKAGITLYHLLTHSSGFPGGIGYDYDPVARNEFVEMALESELLFEPGTRYEYSNVGFSLLVIIVEMVSGLGYEEYLHETFFNDAGMNATGYAIPNWEHKELAVAYRNNERVGTPVDQLWRDDGPGWHLRGNGGILSTVGDMFTWMRAIQGDRIFTEEEKNKIFRTLHVDESNGEGGSFYGYGWVNEPTERGTLIAHNGGNPYFFADCLWWIEDDLNVIILMASRDFVDVAYDISDMIFEGR